MKLLSVLAVTHDARAGNTNCERSFVNKATGEKQKQNKKNKKTKTSTHGAELGHFQNDAMLTDAAEATIRDNNITFDLFQYSNN